MDLLASPVRWTRAWATPRAMSRSSRPAVLAALLGLAACGPTESGAETPAGEQGTTSDQPTSDQPTSAPPTGQPTPGQVTGEATGAPSEPTPAPTTSTPTTSGTASRGSSAIDTATACPRARSCCAAFVDAIGEPVEAERARIACEQMDHLDELGEASGEACVAAIDGWRRALELAERDVPTACR